MSIIKNNLIKNMAADTAIYTAVDSLRAKKFNIDNLMTNTVAIATYNLIVRSIVSGKLSGLFDSVATSILEDYAGRLATLYVSEMFLEGKSPGLGETAKTQLFYSVAIYLTMAGYNEFGLNKVIDQRSTPSLNNSSGFRA